MRLRTLAERLGIQEKDFATIKAKAGSGLKALISRPQWGPCRMTGLRRRDTISPTARPGSSRSMAPRACRENLQSGNLAGTEASDDAVCNAVRKAVDLDESRTSIRER